MKTAGAGAVLAAALLCCGALHGGGKGVLVLQCGSDWCVSGEGVRAAFQSPEFRRTLQGRFELCVYDDMENPTPKVRAANEKVAGLVVRSCRFPAMTCLTGEPRRLFAQLENIPFDVTPLSLAAMVEDAVRRKGEVEKLFAHGRGRGQGPIDALGRGFELLESQTGELVRRRLYEGPFAWSEQWKHLCEVDADDRFGWRRRFSMGYGFDLVEKATDYGRSGHREGGRKFIAKLRKIPSDKLTVVQRQAVEMCEYAFLKGSGSDSHELTPPEADVLKRVLDMGRDTVWGQCALGYLLLSGESIETVPPYRAPVRPRPAAAAQVRTAFPLNANFLARIEGIYKAPREPRKDGQSFFTERERRDIAIYAVLSRIGESGWDALKSRPGSGAFMREFFRDREWMEDFAWSGPCDRAADSLLSLESLYFQDGGKWLDGEDGCGRRFATATALETPGADEAWLADWLDACRGTALSNRFHKTAYSQPVWRWRYATRQLHADLKADDPPNQQRFLDKFYNVSAARFGGAHGSVPYRLFNCFAKSVHSPQYYEPWVRAGEWPKRRYSWIVGGVCGELSTFSSCCSNAHGLPSVPVGQPGHCAYTRRLPDGTWRIDNFISPPTGFAGFWSGSGHWTYTAAAESTFEGEREQRLDADRWLELARFAESRGARLGKVMHLYRMSLNSWPGHYTAWRAYGDWIARKDRPLEEHHAYVRACTKVLKDWRNPLWDLLTPYFDHVSRASGPAALADAIAEFAPFTRQPDKMIQDNGDIASAVKKWARPLEGDPALMDRAIGSVVEAQYGTRTYFAQVLGWCAPFVFSDDDRANRFLKTLPKLAERFSKSMRSVPGGAKAAIEAVRGKPDLGQFLIAAESSGNVAAFRQFAAMQEKVGRPVNGPRYKGRDFSGELVSGEGMLSLSATWTTDIPRKHPRAIDDSPPDGASFCTKEDFEPWAMVTLAGPCELRGVLVVNRGGGDGDRSQLPLAIEASEDGAEWKSLADDVKLRRQHRLEIPSSRAPRARYVRVRRLRGEGKDGLPKKEALSLAKILVYGKKLY
ncbi:MAG: hypothetical protein J6T51_03080 [Kiritimatiellae bacterium]|nr:hypothetical protein [Kiritimatiellia bacterium]